MKKTVFFDQRAEKEFKKFPTAVQVEVHASIKILARDGDEIVILSAFQKKSQKTPIQEVQKAKERLKFYKHE